MINTSELTIAFSGHNIKTCLYLAIKSFLYCYPKLKSKIVVFDDNSTDGTAEWLKKEKIRRISWTTFRKMADQIDTSLSSTIALRVNLIISEIMLQAETKYLLVNDGDIVFLKNGFLENYFSRIENHVGSIFIREYQANPASTKESKSLLKKYASLQTGVGNNLLGAWLFHGFLDLEMLKTNQILFDRLDDHIYNKNLGIFVDSGIDFLFQLRKNRLSHYILDPKFLDQHLIHFTYIGSLSRFASTSKDIGRSRKQAQQRIIAKLTKECKKKLPLQIKKIIEKMDLKKVI